MLAPGSQHAYRFIQADTPELRRLPWARMQDEGLAHAVLWDRVEPTVLDWLDTVSPRTTLTGLAFDDVREGRLTGALWVVPAGLSGTVHFVIFRDWQHDSLRLGREAEQEAESQSIRDEEQRKLRRRQQMGGTVLTSPLGTSGGVASTGSSLLGRMG